MQATVPIEILDQEQVSKNNPPARASGRTGQAVRKKIVQLFLELPDAAIAARRTITAEEHVNHFCFTHSLARCFVVCTHPMARNVLVSTM